MRRLVFVLAAVSLMAVLAPAPSAASSFARQPAAANAASKVKMTLTGTVVGGITSTSAGLALSFVFTEKNTGSTSESVDDLGLTNVVGATSLDVSCVLPGGAEFLPDGTFCEPGTLMPGQSASLVLDTKVTAGPGSSVSARVCVSNEQTGFLGPCVSRSVKSA